MRQQVIGLTGFARVGKDSFYNTASKILFEHGMVATRYALADALKGDIRDFILDKIGIDVYTDDTVAKDIIRPLLVAYGKCKRIQSNGQYWTSLLQKQIESDAESDVIFITDIRYAEYDHDEVQWINETMYGKLIHISKYEIDELGGKTFTKAPNEDEAKNDPVIRNHADILFEWEHCLNTYGEVDTEYMENMVRPVIDGILNG